MMMTQPSQVTTVTLLLQFNQSKLPDDLKNTISLDCLFVVGLANESERERERIQQKRKRTAKICKLLHTADGRRRLWKPAHAKLHMSWEY